MNKELREKIYQFNMIKYGNGNSKENRIIIAKLHPEGMTIASNTSK